jgi:lipoprotein NlpD
LIVGASLGRPSLAALPALLLAACATVNEAPVVDLSTDRGAPARGARVEPSPSARSATALEYVVSGGDTLYGIAFRHGLDYRSLAEWNGIPPPFTIRPGEVLRLQPDAAEAAPASRPASTAASVPPPPKPPLAAGAAPSAVEPAPDTVMLAGPEPGDLPPPGEALTYGIDPGTPPAPEIDDAPDAGPATLSATARPSPAAPAGPSVPTGLLPVPSGRALDARALPAVVPAAPPASGALARAVAEPVSAAPAAATAGSDGPGVDPVAPVADGPARTVGGVRWRWPAEGTLVERFAAGDPARQGINLRGRAGAGVAAAADGEVVYSGNGLVGYGELIIIKHSADFLSAYGHNRRRLVAEGERVRAGQAIAEMGRAPNGFDALHFEVRRAGRPVDPLQFLPPR